MARHGKGQVWVEVRARLGLRNNQNGYNKTCGSYLGVAQVDLTSWDN